MRPPRLRARQLRRIGVFVAVSATVLVVLAAPASAHAVLSGSDPAPQANVSVSPRSITLEFTETVDVRPDAIQLLDGRGESVTTGRAVHPGGQERVVRASVPKLDQGLYTVAWRAISGDSHPIQGAFTFGFGANAAGQAARDLTATARDGEAGDPTVGVLFGVMRFGVFTGLALLLGGGWFAAYLWPEGRRALRVRQLLLGSLVLTGVSTAAGFLLQGPYTSGQGFGALFSSDQISGVWDTRFGKVWILRLALLVVAGLLLRMMVRHRGPLPRWWFGVAGLTGVVLAATPGFAGHASTGRWTAVALPADMLHVLGMAVWLGGLVMLAIARTDDHAYARVAERFSGLALGAVVLLVLTGTVQSIRQLEPISALWDSNYGRILIAKLVAFAVVLLIAAWSRRLVHGRGMGVFGNPATEVSTAASGASGGDGGESTIGSRTVGGTDAALGAAGVGVAGVGAAGVGVLVRDEPAPPRADGGADDGAGGGAGDLPGGRHVHLRRSVRGELIFGAVVLAFTSMLVNTSPPRSMAVGGPLQTVVSAGQAAFQVHLDPASSLRPNFVHITVVGRDGAPRSVVEITATLAMPARDIPPIEITLRPDAPGIYLGQDFRIPFPGEWKLTLTAFVTDVESVTGSTMFTVRGS